MKKILLLISIFIFSYGAVKAQAEATTKAATPIAYNAATLNGEYTDVNNITQDGFFRWGTTSGSYPNTGTASPSTANSNGTAASYLLTGLNPNTTYYYQFYMEVGGIETATGLEVSFTTLAAPSATTNSASSIVFNGATLNGNYTNNGGVVQSGTFEYGTSTTYGSSVTASPSSTSTDNTSASASISGLSAATTYHYRFVMNDGSTTTNGSDQTFTTPDATTNAATSITYKEATLNGTADVGSISNVTIYFAYRTSATGGPGGGAGSWNYSGSISSTGSGTQTYSYDATSLDANKSYDFYIMVWDNTDNAEAAGGSILTFTTHALPTVSTGSAGSITKTSATLNGSGDANDGNFTTSFGYKKHSDVTYTYIGATPSSISGSSSTSFSKSLTGLDAGTTYDFVAALFDGTTKIVEGSAVQFTTNAATAPTGMVTGTIENVDHNSAEINTNTVGDDGGDDITSYGIKYGTSDPPGSQKEMGNTGFASYPANFNASVSGLDPSTKYYVRSYATNSIGTSEGSSKSFYTEPSSSGSVSISGLTDTDHTKLTLDMTGGDGTGKIVVGYLSGASTTIPSDGTTYSGNTAYGSGDALGSGYVLYVGTGSSVTITNLDGDNNDYDFYVYHYAGSGSDINYLQINPASAQTNTTEFPIELLSFTAKNDNGNILINWSTASEWDNDYFEIERSTDAENFEVIANVPGAGYSNEVLTYSIQDNAALEGTVYYRLKQTDYDGAFTYSYVLPITIGTANDLQISNVITKGNSISFVYNNNNGGNTQLQLLDINGRVVKTQQVSGEGSQLVRIGMYGLSHGVYVLHLTLNDQIIVKKVVF